jgi:hypothetical protein
MKLKAFLTTLDGLDSAFHSLYEKTEDGYVLVGVEEKDYKEKLGEFRTNNINHLKRIEELTKAAEAVKDIDPEKYAEMQKTLADLQDKELLDAGKVDELLEQRTERMRTQHGDQIKKIEERAIAAEEAANKYKQNLNSISVNDAVTKTITGLTIVKQGAISDILARASGTWSVGDDGKLQAKDSEGNTRYGKDGKEHLTVKEWAEDLIKEAPFLFEPNSGGSANGSGQPRPGVSMISGNDKQAFSQNLEGIASGKIVVNTG